MNFSAKKMICISLCAIMCLSAAACGTTGENTDNTTTTGGVSSTTVTSTTLAPEYVPVNLPDTDLKGWEFKMAYPKLGGTYEQFDAIEENGDMVNDALYKRRTNIEDRFNCVIKTTILDNPVASAQTAILANDGAYTVVAHNLSAVHTLANQHLLLDLNEVPYVQEGVEKAWWDKNLRENLSINNKLYYNTGDLVVRDDLRIAIMYFNKDMFKKLGLEFPYKYVLDGTWTIDRLMSLVKDVNKDIDGNGKMDQYDQWGLMSQYLNGLHMFHASGEKIAGLNKDGVPELTFKNSRSLEVIQKVLSVSEDGITMFHADGIVGLSQGSTSVWTEASLYFQDNRFLMRTSVFEPIVRDLRAMPTDFGVLPYVKYDEKQEEYYSHVETGATVIGIPMTSDPEKTGLVLEALAYESVSTLTPAFYEVSLNSKILRDNESEAMLDIIFKSKHYDIGYLFSIGGYQNVLGDLVKAKSLDFVSKYESLETAAKEQLKKLADTY